MARRNPLVTQHLESASRRFLEDHQELIRDYVRKRQGVYALYRRGKLYYVGLASNLRIRLGHHLKDRHRDSWDTFSVYLTIGDSHLRELEALLLRIASPGGNKQKGKFARSEDLRRRLTRDYKRSYYDKLPELFGTPTRKKTTKRKRNQKPEGQKGRAVVLAGYIDQQTPLRATYKGKKLRASVRKSGLICFDKQQFTSPSKAAKHAVKRLTCNGWTFWKYQRSPGDWVTLDHLRK
jgi:Restriction Enzyme Adenine Methylase Associated